ncbi:uncharacterized [Tachysurus ichikawai]
MVIPGTAPSSGKGPTAAAELGPTGIANTSHNACKYGSAVIQQIQDTCKKWLVVEQHSAEVLNREMTDND